MAEKVKPRCEGETYDPSGWGHHYRCSRNGKLEENGKWWCKQHAPSSVKARGEASAARWKAEHQKRMAPYEEIKRLCAVNTQLREALEEHGCEIDKIDPCIGSTLTTRGPDSSPCRTCAALERAKK